MKIELEHLEVFTTLDKSQSQVVNASRQSRSESLRKRQGSRQKTPATAARKTEKAKRLKG